MLHLKAKDARKTEVRNIIESCKLSKQLQASQELLASATYLSDIVPVCESVGLNVAEEAQHLMAEVLWDQGEKPTSIRMLQQIANSYPDGVDNISGKASLLAQLVSIALLFSRIRLTFVGP
jgi:ataxia telangiectasia mutated family protein